MNVPSSHLVFCCPHTPACAHTVTLTLEEFREIGAPLCPVHQVHMQAESQEGRGIVKEAVGMIMNGVTLLTAQAMSTWPFRPKDK